MYFSYVRLHEYTCGQSSRRNCGTEAFGKLLENSCDLKLQMIINSTMHTTTRNTTTEVVAIILYISIIKVINNR